MSYYVMYLLGRIFISVKMTLLSAGEEYLLTVGGFLGVGTNYFALLNGMKFSTPDNDNAKIRNSFCLQLQGRVDGGTITVLNVLTSTREIPFVHPRLK